MSEDREIKLPFPPPPIWKLMGIEVVEMSDGYSKLVMPFQEKITQIYGLVHGGAIFTLADSAVAVSVGSIAEPNSKFLTIEMKINFLEPVKEGVIEARAKVLRKGRVIPADVDILNNGRLVAKAIATYIIVGENKQL
ncbi:PaaI family thioesterase [Desulfobacterota bacterium AH_259_B03_O07]|nr:PaaI family thioesterase [Desulfobacterota bacterium AH_259_B03_O07]